MFPLSRGSFHVPVLRGASFTRVGSRRAADAVYHHRHLLGEDGPGVAGEMVLNTFALIERLLWLWPWRSLAHYIGTRGRRDCLARLALR